MTTFVVLCIAALVVFSTGAFVGAWLLWWVNRPDEVDVIRLAPYTGHVHVLTDEVDVIHRPWPPLPDAWQDPPYDWAADPLDTFG